MKIVLATAQLCPKCEHDSHTVEVGDSGPHRKATCTACGAYLRFIGKTEGTPAAELHLSLFDNRSALVCAGAQTSQSSSGTAAEAIGWQQLPRKGCDNWESRNSHKGGSYEQNHREPPVTGTAPTPAELRQLCKDKALADIELDGKPKPYYLATADIAPLYGYGASATQIETFHSRADAKSAQRNAKSRAWSTYLYRPPLWSRLLCQLKSR